VGSIAPIWSNVDPFAKEWPIMKPKRIYEWKGYSYKHKKDYSQGTRFFCQGKGFTHSTLYFFFFFEKKRKKKKKKKKKGLTKN
jgi:hypothetical protein